MCLIVLAWKADPDVRLAVAANRDEFFARATAPAAWWEDAPGRPRGPRPRERAGRGWA